MPSPFLSWCQHVHGSWRIILCAAVAAVVLPLEAANAQHISVTGDISFSVDEGGRSSHVTIRKDSYTLESDGNEVTLRSGSGEVVAHGSKSGSTATIFDATNQGKIIVEEQGNQYAVSERGEVHIRVAVAEKTFTLTLLPDEQHLLHGAKEGAEWRVKRANGVDATIISGPVSLREASFLAVPIATKQRILLWALER